MHSTNAPGAAPRPRSARPAPHWVALGLALLVLAAVLGLASEPAPRTGTAAAPAATPQVIEDWRGNSARIERP